MEIGGIERATAFLRAVASKNPDLATTYIDPDRYVEHNPLAADGAFGLIEYIAHLRQGSDLEVLRAFEDGRYVVIQSQGGGSGKKVFFDVFKLDNGLIVEHWAFSAGPVPRTSRDIPKPMARPSRNRTRTE
jgi:predicted SnoaL-like aldol condensation-catalyzing enzyme